MTDQPPHTPTQARRRTLYGLNVLIAAVAAIGVAVLINALVVWSYDRIDPTAKQWVRYDLTATRAYSLSPQTLKVLGNLEGEHRIVTYFRTDRVSSAALQRVRDLIDEYARFSNDISVRHLDPSYDVVERERFFGDIEAIFAQELAPGQQTLPAALDEMARLQGAFTDVEQALLPLLEDPTTETGQTRQLLRTLVARSQEMRTALEAELQLYREELDQPLPGYNEITTGITSTIGSADQLLGAAVQFIGKAVNQPGVPVNAKEAMLAVSEQMKAAQAKVADTIESLEALERVDRYEDARATLLSQESVALMTEDDVRVIPIGEMFREPDPEAVERTGNPELPFVGEERLTGALVSLGLEHPPLVVFLNGNPQPMMRRGGFSYVADRARAANFEVRTWNAAGTPTPYGQPAPPGPIPEPVEGQRAIYIALPFFPSQDPRAMMSGNEGKQAVADAVADRLEAGDAAMVFLFPDFAASFSQANPVNELIQDWGITAQMDRLVVHETPAREGQTQATSSFEIDRWRGALPVSEALSGLPGAFQLSSPMTLDAEAEGVDQLAPLVELASPRMWTITGVMSLDEVRDAEYDPQTAGDRFTIGAAATRGEARLVVFSEPMFATDGMATFGSSPFRNGAGAALDPFGQAAFPGNAELFVNSLYWLAGLDEMIAAGARTQDIRRIDEINDNAMIAYRTTLLAGMPAAALLAGVAVWAVRRRG
jgi:hypothetical protein